MLSTQRQHKPDTAEQDERPGPCQNSERRSLESVILYRNSAHAGPIQGERKIIVADGMNMTRSVNNVSPGKRKRIEQGCESGMQAAVARIEIENVWGTDERSASGTKHARNLSAECKLIF